MPNSFTLPTTSYPIDATYARLAKRLRVMRETASAAVRSVSEATKREREGGDG